MSTPNDTTIEDGTWERLAEAALEVRDNAYAPYSKFPVGAALLCDDGTIVRGCNMENAAIGDTICAERTAIGQAISEGHRSFRALAVATDLTPPGAPCGSCRQVLSEFCEKLPILLVNPNGERTLVALTDLLPHSFNRAAAGDRLGASPNQSD
jgi:cytidine deaminase